MTPYASWLLLALGLAALWLTGGGPRARAAGFVLVICNQCVWLVYGIATGQHGFVVGAVFYSAAAGRNLWRLRKGIS
jgi:hypothetical protein